MATTPNTDPIYSRTGIIGSHVNLTTAAADYTGTSYYNREVFAADSVNGGYIQRLRFKARGTNVATVARIYINKSFDALIPGGGVNTNFAAAPTAPTGTPSAAGGTMLTGAYFGTVIAVGPQGSQTPVGAFSTVVNVTGPTGSIAWTWTAVAGAESYRIYVGPPGAPTGFATRYFTSATNSYTQTAMPETGTNYDPYSGTTALYGELSLPATTAIATAATVDIDYPMNIALPAGYEIYVGLGTTVAAGWQVTAIGGSY